MKCLGPRHFHLLLYGAVAECNSWDKLQSMITSLDKQMRIVGRKRNMQKTIVMLHSLGTAQRFEQGGEAVEVVSDYFYLGQADIPDPNYEAEII